MNPKLTQLVRGELRNSPLSTSDRRQVPRRSPGESWVVTRTTAQAVISKSRGVITGFRGSLQCSTAAGVWLMPGRGRKTSVQYWM